MPTPHLHLTALPAELLSLIVGDEQLSLKDLTVLARTCNFFYHVATSHLYRFNTKHEHSSALIWAAMNGRIRTMRRALELGADPDAVGPASCQRRVRRPENWVGDETMWKYVFEDKRWCQSPHHSCGTALHYAAKAGDNDMVNLLLDYQADIDASSCCVCHCQEHWNLGSVHSHIYQPHWFPLHHAVCQGHTTTANILLDRGASMHLSIVEETGEGYIEPPNLLHCASARGLEGLVQRALETDPTLLGRGADSPLHYATESWNSEGVIRRLVCAGADLEHRGLLMDIGTPMFRACEIGNFSTAMHLLRAGASTRPRPCSPSHGLSSDPLLHLAVRSRNHFIKDIPLPQEDRDREQVAFVRALIEEFGFDVNQPIGDSRWPCTPLIVALNGDDRDEYYGPAAIPSLIETLLDAGADPNHVGPRNLSPSHLAACEFDNGDSCGSELEISRRPDDDAWQVLSTLIRFGARLDLMDGDGNSALSYIGDIFLRGDPDGNVWELFQYLAQNSSPETLSAEHKILVYKRMMKQLAEQEAELQDRTERMS